MRVLTGEKKMLATYRNYLVIVGREHKRTDATAVSKVNTLTIYDPANKFIAFGAGFNDIHYVLNEWGAIYVLTGACTIVGSPRVQRNLAASVGIRADPHAEGFKYHCQGK